MNLQSVYGLFAQGVIVAALIRFVRVLTGHAKAKPHGIELWLPVMLLLAGSAEGVTFAGHLRGLWGDPSIVTLLLLFLFTLQPSWLPSRPRPTTCLLITLLVTVPLYGPMLLPVPAVQDNLYAIGWQPWSLLIAITLGALIMWRSLQRTWLNIIALALLAYAGRLMESDNLWDYLVDPGLLVTIAFLGFTGIWISLQRRLKAI
jgi:hypothetical protein